METNVEGVAAYIFPHLLTTPRALPQKRSSKRGVSAPTFTPSEKKTNTYTYRVVLRVWRCPTAPTRPTHCLGLVSLRGQSKIRSYRPNYHDRKKCCQAPVFWHILVELIDCERTNSEVLVPMQPHCISELLPLMHVSVIST